MNRSKSRGPQVYLAEAELEARLSDLARAVRAMREAQIAYRKFRYAELRARQAEAERVVDGLLSQGGR